MLTIALILLFMTSEFSIFGDIRRQHSIQYARLKILEVQQQLICLVGVVIVSPKHGMQ
jgi:hypothetical protein